MNKQQFNKRVNEILIQLHRGFLTEEVAKELTDRELLAMVQPDGVTMTPVPGNDDERRATLTPFTRKWVRKSLKKYPTITAYDLLVSTGFKDSEDET